MPERFANLLPYISEREISEEENGAMLYQEETTYPMLYQEETTYPRGFQNEKENRIEKSVFYEKRDEKRNIKGNEERIEKRGEQAVDKNGMR